VVTIERAAPAPVTVVRLRGPHFLLQAAPEAAWRAIAAAAGIAPAA
jgi:hypothetical protein